MSNALELKRFVLGPEHNGMRMTPAELDAVEERDEDHVYELVEGVVVVSPAPSESERDPNEELGYWLRVYRDTHRHGSRIDATLTEQYIRTARSRRRADRAIWIGLGRTPRTRVDSPAIAIEFASPGRRSWVRDYQEKKKECLALGIKAYWIIDRFQRTLTAHTKHRERISTVVLSARQTYRPALLPGFALPVGRLLALADRWAQV